MNSLLFKVFFYNVSQDDDFRYLTTVLKDSDVTSTLMTADSIDEKRL